jgi:hypothetical protein
MTSDTDAAYYAKERPEVVPFLPPAAERVLEVGCSEGRFRTNLPKTCECRDVELSAKVARVAATVLDPCSSAATTMSAWYQIDAPRHLVIPSQRGLRLVAQQLGLEMARVEYDSNETQFGCSEQYAQDVPLRDASFLLLIVTRISSTMNRRPSSLRGAQRPMPREKAIRPAFISPMLHGSEPTLGRNRRIVLAA